MIPSLRGALALSCAVAALFFARFWREGRDRMFAVFACAFLELSVSWGMLGITGLNEEENVHVFVLRAGDRLVVVGAPDAEESHHHHADGEATA